MSKHAYAERSADTAAEAALAVRGQRAGTAPPVAAQGEFSGGRPLEPAVSAAMRNGFGWDFAAVRVHDDSEGARLAASSHAHAATLGTHIAFAPGTYQPETLDGDRLIAHELAHVVQQQHTGPMLQLQRKKTLAGDDTITIDWKIHFKLGHPTAAELDAEPSAVLTPDGLLHLGLVKMWFRNDPFAQAQLEGNSSSDGKPEANVRMSGRRARWLARTFDTFRVADVPGNASNCEKVSPGAYACGSAHAAAKADPNDCYVAVRMFRKPGAPVAAKGSASSLPDTKASQGTMPSSWTLVGGSPNPLGGPRLRQNKEPNLTGFRSPPTSALDLAKDYRPIDFSLQATFFQATFHNYLLTGSTRGPTDPLSEFGVAITAAGTRAFHDKGDKGAEFANPIQLSYSFTTKQWTFLSGPMLSYVLPLSETVSAGVFAQLAGGANLTTGIEQFQPNVGTQIGWQAKPWLNIGLTFNLGENVPKSGPATIDSNLGVGATIVPGLIRIRLGKH